MSDNLKELVKNDPDFVYSPKHGNNINSVIKDSDTELSNRKIARLLLISELEVEEMYNKIVIPNLELLDFRRKS